MEICNLLTPRREAIGLASIFFQYLQYLHIMQSFYKVLRGTHGDRSAVGAVPPVMPILLQNNIQNISHNDSFNACLTIISTVSDGYI